MCVNVPLGKMPESEITGLQVIFVFSCIHIATSLPNPQKMNDYLFSCVSSASLTLSYVTCKGVQSPLVLTTHASYRVTKVRLGKDR